MESKSLKGFFDTVKSDNLKEISNANTKTTTAYDVESADGLPYYESQYHQYSFNFLALEQSGYASLGISQSDNMKLEDFGIYNNGASAGTFTSANTFINQDTGIFSHDPTVNGNYVENYGVGGIYT